MSTIAEKLTAIAEAKSNIKDAITAKGQTVGDDLTTYATAIGNISGGGTSWTGHVDETGLKAIGWTDEDVEYYQKHGVSWNEEDDDIHKVSAYNISLYINAEKTVVGGVEMATAANLSTFKNDIRCKYFPKIDLHTATSLISTFYNCSHIIAFPDMLIASPTSLTNTFYECHSLSSIDVSKWDMSQCTNMNSTFIGCYNLKEIDVSGWDTSACTNMPRMFNNCAEIGYLDVSKWDTSACTNMQGMFQWCNNLKEIDVSGWDTSACTNLSGIFNGCYNLEYLDMSNWDTSKATLMPSMFTYCYGMYRLLLSDKFKMDSVTSTGYIPGISHSTGASCDYDTVKSVFEAINATTTTLSSPAWGFAKGAVVEDDESGTLQTLCDACVAKGWTISNLTINSYGS